MAARSGLTGGLLLAALLAAASPLAAQDGETDGDQPAFLPDQSEPPIIRTETVEAARGTGAVLYGLDKVTGRTTELRLDLGEAVRFGRLEIRLGECRYPIADPASDAYAQLLITDLIRQERVFSGWMIASSQALSALDDTRYDVWVIACTG